MSILTLAAAASGPRDIVKDVQSGLQNERARAEVGDDVRVWEVEDKVQGCY